MKLSVLLQGMPAPAEVAELEISSLCYDSRKAKPGSLFLAIRGLAQDGNTYIGAAAEKGAVAVVTDVQPETELPIPHILVPDARAAMAHLSARFYGNPQDSLTLVGVTGTNGKTTVANLLGGILNECGYKCGIIGTVGVILPGLKTIPLDRTTPESCDLYQFLAQMRERGCTHAVMEVSSHALELMRVEGLRFEAGIFTNLTQDHLDFHGTMEAYLAAKAKLFEVCKTAVMNFDDPAWEVLVAGKPCQVLTYSQESLAATLIAKNVKLMQNQVTFDSIVRGSIARVSLGIPGLFSVYNALAAIGGALAVGVPLEAAALALAGLSGISGRAEVVPVPAEYTVLIDYAHTPDSMENILRAVRGFAEGRVIGLFGCGGDRDRTKRPLMGRTGAQHCDVCIVTSDNPRSEKPRAIIEDIIPGLMGFDKPVHIITDRREAIAFALRLADPGDVVVLMGKGHETYQEIDGKKHHLDEREVVAEYFARP